MLAKTESINLNRMIFGHGLSPRFARLWCHFPASPTPGLLLLRRQTVRQYTAQKAISTNYDARTPFRFSLIFPRHHKSGPLQADSMSSARSHNWPGISRIPTGYSQYRHLGKYGWGRKAQRPTIEDSIYRYVDNLCSFGSSFFEQTVCLLRNSSVMRHEVITLALSTSRWCGSSLTCYNFLP